jgi:hypothetical protein
MTAWPVVLTIQQNCDLLGFVGIQDNCSTIEWLDRASAFAVGLVASCADWRHRLFRRV